MSNKVIKYGVVGLGRGADVAIEGIGMECAKLCAACDHNPETLEKAKKQFEEKGLYDCTYYADYDEMLKSDIDAVIVATEAIYHVPIVKKAMEAGKHVLSEIPSINSLEEAHELKAIVSAHLEDRHSLGLAGKEGLDDTAVVEVGAHLAVVALTVMRLPAEGVAPDDQTGGVNAAKIHGRKAVFHIIISILFKVSEKSSFSLDKIRKKSRNTRKYMVVQPFLLTSPRRCPRKCDGIRLRPRQNRRQRPQ